MNRDQLAHVLRAASTASGRTDILVIGSQAILGSFDEDDLPIAATISIGADLGILDEDGDAVADVIDGAIGELSPFHRRNGYYAQGIGITTATLPAGWRGRLVLFENESTAPGRGWCLEPHDLVIAKLVRGDPKDYDFADALRQIEAVNLHTLGSRIDATVVSEAVRSRIRRWVDRGERG